LFGKELVILYQQACTNRVYSLQLKGPAWS